MKTKGKKRNKQTEKDDSHIYAKIYKNTEFDQHEKGKITSISISLMYVYKLCETYLNYDAETAIW